MDSLSLFGAIIEWKGSKYVYLIEVGLITYLAKIVEDKIVAKQFIDRRKFVEEASQRGDFKLQKRLNDPVYCFVILSTAEFRDTIALLHKLDHDSTSSVGYSRLDKLNEKDLDALKSEIKDNEDSLPPDVVDYVKSLDKK